MILREVCLTTSSLAQGKAETPTGRLGQFGFETQCVGDLYRRNLPKLVTRETAKVLIDLKEDPDWVVPRNIQRFLNVTQSPWTIGFEDYWSATELERKRLALEALHQGLVWLAGVEGWPPEPFHIAYKACLDQNLSNAFLTKKAMANPSGSARIRLFCDFRPTEARISAILFRGRTEVGQIDLGATVPEAYCVAITLGSLKWVNDQTIEIQLDHAKKLPPARFDLTPWLCGK